MALTTALARASAVGLAKPATRCLPFPSGAITQDPRQDVALSYAGLSVKGPFVPEWAANANQLVGPIAPQPETH